MGLAAIAKRLIRSVTPLRRRALGGPFIQCLPNGAAQLVDLHATPALNKWGDVTVLLATGANTTDCWVEAVVCSEIATAAELNVAITMQATGIAVTADFEAVVAGYLNTADCIVIPIDPPVYIRAGSALSIVAAGTKAWDVWVIISREK